MSRYNRKRVTTGLTLIVVGTVLYAFDRVQGLSQASVLLVLGLAFLAAYLQRRSYGLLVPAGILLGLASGMLFRGPLSAIGRPQLLGLGAGFIAIYFIALLRERKSHPWPLIPGTILSIIAFPNGADAFEYLFEHWSLMLVVLGVLILLGAMGRPSTKPPD
ncbi:MAG: hypothetical protein V3S30_11065 [Thermoanaerobaculia bacterium]